MTQSTTTPSRNDLAAKLRPYGQEHLLRFWDELNPAGRGRLAAQIDALNFEQIASLIQRTAKSQDWVALSRRAEPPPAKRLEDRQSGERFEPTEAERFGTEALSKGKIGVLLAAGGQGSRLGFDHPKGLYPIGPVSGRSLLEIHFQKVLALSRRHGVDVPIYIMTSPVTHEEQSDFLQRHDWFGLPSHQVKLFRQGTMPAVDAKSGRLLQAEKDALFLSPDGHGGMLAALAASGAIDDMRRRAVEHLFYLQVDNPLVPIGDAEFIGHHLLADSDLTSMAVSKQTPQDRLGNFALVDGRLHVIEYSDFPTDVAEQRSAAGQLVFWAGSIAVHMFRVAFLERMLDYNDALPFHVAHKKVPYIDDAGRLVEPDEPNALKFERFIFDLLPQADRPLVVEYAEEDVFAPLKNAPGAERDTVDYVQRFMVAQHRRWLAAAGTGLASGVPVEISPLWALDAADVANRPSRPAVIDAPTYLS